MRKTFKCLVVLLLSLVLFVTACNGFGGAGNTTESGGDVYQDYESNKNPGDDQFDFDGNYAAPELKIDGLGEDEQWKNITEPLAIFGHDNAASVKAYRGTDALFFLFEVKDAILLTEGNANDDTVTRSDSIEFYLDTLANGGNKPQNDDYQINLGIHGKTRIMQGSGSGWGNWNGLIDYEVSLNGILNDSNEATDIGYTVEVMIPYTQINIEKEDTIALSFGQVDKTNNGGSSAGMHWDWYGWNYGYIREPQTPNNYVLLDKDNNLLDRDAEARPNADIAGYVLDNATGVAVEGATVELTASNFAKTTKTDSQGFFLFEDLSPEYDYTATVTLEGYLGNSTVYTRSELRASNGGRVLKDITVKNEETIARTTLSGTVKNLIHGAVANATIAIEGTLMTATANGHGEFSIEGVPVEEEKALTLVVSASGYAESKTYINGADLTVNGESAIGDVNIHLPYATASGSNGFGNKSDKFADSSIRVGRALTGIEFLLQGTRKLDGHLEIYLDTKESSTEHRDNESSLWMFQLTGEGNIQGSHFKGGAFTLAGLEYDLFTNTPSGYTARFFIPYEYLDITPLEVFGISLGQWSTTANDWDGWGYAGQFVAPEFSAQYIRVSANNEFYRANNNQSMVVLSGNTGVAGVRVSAGGNAVTTGNDGNWNFRIPTPSEELTITYTALGYETVTTVLEAGYFNTRFSYHDVISMQEQYATIRGVVRDSATGAPLSGVMVSTGTKAVQTDEEGKYELSGLWTKNAVTLTISKADYATQTKDISASDLASSELYVYDVSLVSTNLVSYVTASGVVTNVAGPIKGASVKLEGEEIATTDANGAFVIENFKGVDCVLSIEKAGYQTQTVVFKASSLEAGATTYTFESVDMPKEYLSLGELEEKPEGKQHAFARFSGYVTRTATAFEFKFVGARAFNNGQLEVYIDTGSVASTKGATEVQLNITSDKSIIPVRGPLNTSNITAVFGGTDDNPQIYLTIPYASLGIGATDIIGFYMGQWSTTVADWDPLTFEGVALNADVTAQHLRISGSTVVYRYATNEEVVTLKGNVGVEGVTVRIGSTVVVSDSNGAYSALIAKPAEDLTVTYTKSGYVKQTVVIPANAFATAIEYEQDVQMVEHLVTLSGTVTDSSTGAGIEGVTVAVKGSDITAITNANGEYVIENLASAKDVVIVMSRENYATQELTVSAQTLASANEHTLNANLICTLVVKSVDVFGVVSNVNGAIEGAVVSVNGSDITAITNANGEFTLEGVTAVDHVITIEKAGYIAVTIEVLESDFAEDAVDHNLGNIDLMLEYGVMPGIIADKATGFAAWKGYVTRSNVGFEFKFVGARAFVGNIELFVDTKTSAGDNARDLTDYLFMLKSDGVIQIVNWGTGVKNESIPENMKLTVKNADNKPEVYFTLPYAFFGQVDSEMAIQATEVIGISVGQFSNTASDWDGWDCFALIGASNTEFVKPEMPTDYIRISADNVLYAKADNVAVELGSYYFHFGTGMVNTQSGATDAGALGSAGLNADDMRAKIASRNENGVTFEIVTTGNFSVNSATGEKEMILIYFDTGVESINGWKPDYLIKIASDGTVYGRANNAWWSASESDKLATSATITTENGVTKIVYTVSYQTLGIGASDVFGVALRECSHNSGDHMLYDPWHDFYFANETTGRDAALCTDFIRVNAQGGVYVDNNNNPND